MQIVVYVKTLELGKKSYTCFQGSRDRVHPNWLLFGWYTLAIRSFETKPTDGATIFTLLGKMGNFK